MFKNRALQVKVVKSVADGEETVTQTMSVADTMYIVHETGKSLVKGVIALTAVYVALDTARQVTVNAAPKR